MKNYNGTLPFWYWNGDMSEAGIIRQMKDMRSRGVNEVMVCPTAGIETEYPSPEYFKKVSFACAQAEKLGMGIWLYDDYNWPSGSAGGKLLREHPEYRMKFLRCYYKKIPADAPREIKLKIEDGEILAAYLIKDNRATSPLDIRGEIDRWDTEEIKSVASFLGCDVPVTYACRAGTLKAPDGSWEFLAFVITLSRILHVNTIGSRWCGDEVGYVDMMNPGMTDEFIRLTHAQYEKYAGKYFGSVIKGIFTDEPTMLNIHGWPEGWDEVTHLPWTRSFEEIFRNKTGYDIVSVLQYIVLHQGMTATTIKFRRDYWETIKELYFSSYHRKMRSWCDKRNLIYIGHLLSDKVPHGWVECHGDYYRAMEAFTVPALDYCWSRPMIAPERPYNWKTYEYVNAKMVSSIAFHNDVKGVCCETFALGGYGANLGDFRATTGFLAALGVNMTLTAGAVYTMRGNRRRVLPTAHSFQAPFWKYYGLYSGYVKKISGFMRSSRHNADCCLVYSVFDMQCANSRSQKGEEIAGVVRLLLENQADFDFVHEEMLDGAKVKDGKIRIGRQDYSAIILPPLNVINARAWQKIQEFISGGGRAFSFWKKPGVTSTGDIAEGAEPEALDETNIKQKLAGERTVEFIFPEGTEKSIIFNKRKAGKQDCYFVFYFGAEEISGSIIIRGEEPVALLDLETGKGSRVFGKKVKGGTEIPVTLKPNTALIFKNTGKAKGRPARPDPGFEKISEFSGGWQIKPLSLNVAFLEKWQILDNEKWMEAKPERLLLDHPCSEGKRVRACFNLDFIPKKLSMAYEPGIIEIVSVNNKQVNTPEKKSSFFDTYLCEKEISGHIREGVNTVEAIMKLPDWERRVDYYGKPTLAPMFILGKLSVKGGLIKEMPEKLEMGSWSEQGFPNYSGSIVYRRKFIFNGSRRLQPANVFVQADVFNGVMNVRVNGKKAGVRAWDPYRVCISRFARNGENTLEIEVTNTLSNFIEKPIPSGLKSCELYIKQS